MDDKEVLPLNTVMEVRIYQGDDDVTAKAVMKYFFDHVGKEISVDNSCYVIYIENINVSLKETHWTISIRGIFV